MWGISQKFFVASSLRFATWNGIFRWSVESSGYIWKSQTSDPTNKSSLHSIHRDRFLPITLELQRNERLISHSCHRYSRNMNSCPIFLVFTFWRLIQGSTSRKRLGWILKRDFARKFDGVQVPWNDSTFDDLLKSWTFSIYSLPGNKLNKLKWKSVK